MDKIKNFLYKKSIKTIFIFYMLACIFSSLFSSILLSCLFQYGQSKIYKKHEYHYIAKIELYENADMDNDSITVNYPTKNIISLFTPFENHFYNIFSFLSFAVYPICFGICIIITSTLFYKKQLETPLTILDKAADSITENNLDFKIVYDRQNELGKLCISFEKMRKALKENNLEMWRQIEERKRLNAAFSHDLRTPLTVLKGQCEMLVKYFPQMSADKIISTAKTMQRHIIRLESYVNTMNDLQRLEDIEINKSLINSGDIIKQIHTTGILICQDKNFTFSDNILKEDKLYLDFEIIMRVYENLLSNAVRFAKKNIVVSVNVKNNYFYLIVSDDGNGFTKKELSNAVKPFYKSVNETDNSHFGMGLNICKVLCEKHGGYLKLKNNNGALITAAFKQ